MLPILVNGSDDDDDDIRSVGRAKHTHAISINSGRATRFFTHFRYATIVLRLRITSDSFRVLGSLSFETRVCRG